MDTAPKDQKSLTFDAPRTPPRERKPGEVLWTLRKGQDLRRAELRDHVTAGAGVELQIFNALDLISGVLYLSRAIAEHNAEDVRQVFLGTGWTIVP